MHRRLRSKYSDSGKRGHTASDAATLFVKNKGQFYIAATLAHMAGEKRNTLNNNSFKQGWLSLP